MRVLHTLWSAEFGGIERLALDLAMAQSEQGVTPAFLFGQRRGQMLPEFVQCGLESFDAAMSSGWDCRTKRRSRIMEFMRRFDIIHMHVFTPLVASATARCGCKIVFTDHGNYGLGRRWTVRDRAKRFLQRRFFQNNVDYVSFNSQFTEQLARDCFGDKLPKSSVIYNGIDLSTRQSDSCSLPAEHASQLSGKFVVGTTSRLAGFKRVDRLIDAFARFLGSEKDSILLIVGDGPLRGELQHQTRDCGISEQVVFTGYQSNVAAYQKAMDVCVFPSAGEPFGLVAVEALSIGKPTIVMSDGGGIVEIVKPIAPQDVVDGIDGLAQRLREYRRNASNGAQLEEASDAKTRIQRAAEFDIRRMSRDFEQVYRELIPSLSAKDSVAC